MNKILCVISSIGKYKRISSIRAYLLSITIFSTCGNRWRIKRIEEVECKKIVFTSLSDGKRLRKHFEKYV